MPSWKLKTTYGSAESADAAAGSGANAAMLNRTRSRPLRTADESLARRGLRVSPARGSFVGPCGVPGKPNASPIHLLDYVSRYYTPPWASVRETREPYRARYSFGRIKS